MSGISGIAANATGEKMKNRFLKNTTTHFCVVFVWVLFNVLRNDVCVVLMDCEISGESTKFSVVDGKSAVEKVNADDEWLCEAYMKTDYSKLTKDNFQRTLNNYLAYLIKEGNVYEDNSGK